MLTSSEWSQHSSHQHGTDDHFLISAVKLEFSPQLKNGTWYNTWKIPAQLWTLSQKITTCIPSIWTLHNSPQGWYNFIMCYRAGQKYFHMNLVKCFSGKWEMESNITLKQYIKIVQICRKHIEVQVQIKKQIIWHQQARKRETNQLNINRQ